MRCVVSLLTVEEPALRTSWWDELVTRWLSICFSMNVATNYHKITMYSLLVLEARNPRFLGETILFFLPGFWQLLVSLHALSWSSPKLPVCFHMAFLYSVHDKRCPLDDRSTLNSLPTSATRIAFSPLFPLSPFKAYRLLSAWTTGLQPHMTPLQSHLQGFWYFS